MTNKKTIHFSEHDIRSKKFDVGRIVAFMEDVAFLNKEKNKFVSVSCPACETNDYIQKFNKNGFNYVECRKCGTLYTNPRPTSEILENFYKNSKAYAYWNNTVFPASEKIRRKKIFIPRVDRIIEICRKYSIRTGSAMEVGAGFGTFCEELKSRHVFKRIVGVEPTPELAETCRKKGIEVIENPIEKINFKKNNLFDIIANFEVIEHLFSPKKFIKKCESLLKRGGLFIVACPNIKGFDFTVLGKECNSIDHEHLNYFHPNSLKLLAEKCGFEVLEITTPGKLDAELVRNKILDGSFNVSGSPFLKEVLIYHWDEAGEKFQDFLSQNGLSSSMWMVARRR